MQVVTDLESIYRGEHSIIGIVYIQADDIVYPENVWTDFIVVILGWWVQAVNALQYLSPKEAVSLQFMDGPYSVRLEYLDDHTALAQFIARGQSTTSIQHEQIIDIDVFKQSLQKCIKQVVNKCQREGWQGNDVASLEMALKKLSR